MTLGNIPLQVPFAVRELFRTNSYPNAISPFNLALRRACLSSMITGLSLTGEGMKPDLIQVLCESVGSDALERQKD